MHRYILAIPFLLLACTDESDMPTALTSGDTAADPTNDPTEADTGEVCGDALVGEDKGCEEGNMDDADAPPKCSDGLHNGGETDVDCGNTCPPCTALKMCVQNGDCDSFLCDPEGICTGFPASCLELHSQHPSLPDGEYSIYPPGENPMRMICDMTGGGWTEVLVEDMYFVSFWTMNVEGVCGDWTDTMMGGPGLFGVGASSEKELPLLAIPHTKIKLVADAIVIDNWDGESLILEVDGAELDAIACSQDDPSTCGPYEDQCGAPEWLDGRVTLAGELEHTSGSVLVRFTSTLDETADEEAWGIDNVVLWAL